MNWWNILKNQIASTKGKTFQLDFNQPMIEEEENCKERLIKMVDALSKIDLRDYFRYPYLNKKMPVEDFKRLSESEYTYESGVPQQQDHMRYRLANKIGRSFANDNMTEEVACRILQEVKKEKAGEFSFSRKSDEIYDLTLVITAANLPQPYNIQQAGLYYMVIFIDLLQHYDHFAEDVCEIDRLEKDIAQIFANA